MYESELAISSFLWHTNRLHVCRKINLKSCYLTDVQNWIEMCIVLQPSRAVPSQAKCAVRKTFCQCQNDWILLNILSAIIQMKNESVCVVGWICSSLNLAWLDVVFFLLLNLFRSPCCDHIMKDLILTAVCLWTFNLTK